MKVYRNGSLVDAAEATVSVFDHGLLYGDGIFEGIRLYQRNIFRLDAHLERLEFSARAIMLKLPWTRQEIARAVIQTCQANNLVDGYIRLVVTRGPGTLGLSPTTCKDPQLIVIADTIELYPKTFYTEGLKIITVPTQRVDHGALSPMIKSLNYLNNVLAKIEAQQLGFMEAVMINAQGYVAECTGDNIFVLQKGKLYTPPAAAGSLKGITREVVIEIAAELGISLVECNLTRYDLWVAEEFFLTGTAAEVVPVIEMDGRPIGDGKPGPVFGRFLDAFHKRVTEDGTKLD